MAEDSCLGSVVSTWLTMGLVQDAPRAQGIIHQRPGKPSSPSKGNIHHRQPGQGSPGPGELLLEDIITSKWLAHDARDDGRRY